MRADKHKQRLGAATTSQLDLFGGSIVREAPSASPPITPQARSGAKQPDRKPRSEDPLVAFVLSGRARGRPEKQLAMSPANATDPRRLLDVREAANRLGLSKSTLDKMRCSGRGPRFIRATDRAVRYDPADLDAFANERRRRSTSDEVLAGLGS